MLLKKLENIFSWQKGFNVYNVLGHCYLLRPEEEDDEDDLEPPPELLPEL